MANQPEAAGTLPDGQQSPKPETGRPQTRKIYLNYLLYMDKRIVERNGTLHDFFIASDLSGKLQWRGMVIEGADNAINPLKVDIKKNYASWVRRVQ